MYPLFGESVDPFGVRHALGHGLIVTFGPAGDPVRVLERDRPPVWRHRGTEFCAGNYPVMAGSVSPPANWVRYSSA
ncbi:hypothetical protein GCM10028793_29210 [Nocardiopsis oceani]